MAQTIAAPVLNCITKDLVGGNDTLRWDTVVAQPCGAFVCYLLYKAPAMAGPYTLVATINTQSTGVYTDAGAANSTWYYYIRDSFGCAGATYLSSDTILNETNPKTPALKSVDVLPDGTVQINWYASTSPQTKAYIVYGYTTAGSLVALDTVYGRFNTSWIDSNDNPALSSLKYTIVALDLCNGNQPSAFNTAPQQSILQSYQGARCDRAVKFFWNTYINYPSGVLHYIVLVNKNNTGYVAVASLDSSIHLYSYPDFNDGDSLQVTIEAVSASDSNVIAHSNYIRFVASIVQPPAYIYLTNLTVNIDNSISMVWRTDIHAQLLDFQIENSEDSMIYNNVIVESVILPLPPSASYRDTTPSPQFNPFFYHVIAIDSCGGKRFSPPGKTINLTADLTDYYEIALNWNAFELYGIQVLRYNLYRDYGSGYQLIHTFDSLGRTFVDSVYQLLDQKGNFCYRIEAVYTIHLPDANYSDTLSSWSNVACVDHRPIIYVPNAFVPNGVNNVFKPRIIFGDPQGYNLFIFNRGGGQIFESHNPAVGWDGTDHGKVVQQGGYAYLIQFTASDGTPVERKGIVLLISK